MRKLILALALVLLAAPVSAGTWTVTTNGTQDNRLDRARKRVNADTCTRLGLPATCTQSQARAVVPGTDVYSDVGDFCDRFVVQTYYATLKDLADASDVADAKAAWDAMSNAQKNAVCAAFTPPLGNGCLVVK